MWRLNSYIRITKTLLIPTGKLLCYNCSISSIMLKGYFKVMWPGWHHLLFIKVVSPLPLFCLLSDLFLSTQNHLKAVNGNNGVWSISVEPCVHGCPSKGLLAHPSYCPGISCCLFMIEGKYDLYLLFSTSLCWHQSLFPCFFLPTLRLSWFLQRCLLFWSSCKLAPAGLWCKQCDLGVSVQRQRSWL